MCFRRVKNKIVNMSIKRQLFIYFFTFTVLPLVLVSAAAFGLASRIIGNSAQSYAYETISQLSENIDHLLSQIETTSLAVAYNSEIQSTLNRISDGEESSRLDVFRVEQSMILTYDYAQMRDITIHTPQNLSFRVPNNMGSYEENFYPPKELYIPPHRAVWYHNSENQVIQMARNIESSKDFRRIGTLYISLYSGFMDSLAANISFAESGFIMVLNQDDAPIMLKDIDPIYVNTLRDMETDGSGNFTARINGILYRFFYHTSEYTGWKSVGVISLNQLYSQVWRLGGLILGCILVIGIIATWLFKKLSLSFSNRVIRVTEAMKKTSEGDFSSHLPEAVSKNEFNDLNIGFNQMVSKINSLIETVYETRLLQKESEYEALQAQINPHFLYNTLDTICWQAKLQNNEDIFRTTYSLASLLRASVGNQAPFVTVKEEISYIQDYLNIQKARFRDNVEISIAVAPELETMQVPKLILQPVVENAFIHGLEKKRRKGKLTIRGMISEENKTAVFLVEDNGAGMTQEQIDQLFLEDENRKQSIGLRNVQRRLQILYGDAYGVQVDSVLQEGTTVVLRLPYADDAIR